MFEPVVIEHHMDHAFQKKPKREGSARNPPGCAVCNRARTHMDHHGHTQSLNYYLSKDIQVWRAMKDAWQQRLEELIRRSELEPCGRIVVEGVMCWPRRVVPDQGNHRVLLEKALGDALTNVGILEDDDWGRYEFGGLEYRYAAGEAWTRLMLFPIEEPLLLLEPKTSQGKAPQAESLF